MLRFALVLSLLLVVLGVSCTRPPVPLTSTPPGFAAASSTPAPTSSPSPPTASPPAPQPMRQAQAHGERSFTRLAWSPDGQLLASYGNDDRVMVWDADTLEPLLTLIHPGLAFIGFASFSPAGRWLLVGEARHIEQTGGGNTAFEVSVWDLQNETRQVLLSPASDLLLAAWNAEETLLAYLLWNEAQIRFWAVPGSAAVAPEPVAIPSFNVGKLRWQADGTLAAIGVAEQGFVHWRSTLPATLNPVDGPPFEEAIRSYSPDGTLAVSLVELPVAATVSISDLGLAVWDTTRGELRYALQSHDFYGLGGLAFSPDNAWLATAKHAVNVYAPVEDEVRVWDLASGGLVAILPGGRSEIISLDFSPDGKRLAAGEANGGIRLWQLDAYLHAPATPAPVPTATPVRRSRALPVFLTSLSLPGVTPDEPGTLNSLRWLDEDTLQLITLSHNFDQAAWQTSWRQRLTRYDLRQGRILDSQLGAEQFRAGGAGSARAYSPDGERFAYWLWLLTAPGQGIDGAVEVLDTATNQLLFQVPADQIGAGNYFAWSPDGGQIAVQTDQSIEVFEVPSGAHRMTLENVIEQAESPGAIYDELIWSLDGKWIASNLQGETARHRVVVWEAAGGTIARSYIEQSIYGGGTSVDHIAFSPDGNRLLLVKGEVAVLDLRSGEVQPMPAGTGLSQFVGTGAWSADGGYVAVDYRQVYRGAASVLIWNTQTGETFILYTRVSESSSELNLVWAPHYPWLATIDDHIVIVLDAEEQAIIRVELAVTSAPERLVWSPEGRRLAIVGAEGIVEIWEFPAFSGAP